MFLAVVEGEGGTVEEPVVAEPECPPGARQERDVAHVARWKRLMNVPMFSAIGGICAIYSMIYGTPSTREETSILADEIPVFGIQVEPDRAMEVAPPLAGRPVEIPWRCGSR